jgi:hypothetical protein
VQHDVDVTRCSSLPSQAVTEWDPDFAFDYDFGGLFGETEGHDAEFPGDTTDSFASTELPIECDITKPFLHHGDGFLQPDVDLDQFFGNPMLSTQEGSYSMTDTFGLEPGTGITSFAEVSTWNSIHNEAILLSPQPPSDDCHSSSTPRQRSSTRNKHVKDWFLANTHFPYPSRDELTHLVTVSGLSKRQVRICLSNLRARTKSGRSNHLSGSPTFTKLD